jgi:hypothetical protein
MIKTEEQIEEPGIRAIDHPCEMKVESPEQEGQFIKCRILANVQCSECTAWICGTEELEHAIICVRCNNYFCAECYPGHRLKNDCQEIAA